MQCSLTLTTIQLEGPAASMAASALPLPLPLPQPSPAAGRNNKNSSPVVDSPPKPTLKTPTIRSRLGRICQEGQPHLARQLFDTIPEPTTVMWNTILIGFICNDLPDEALLFYAEMKRSAPPTQCDSYTYSTVLKACSEVRDLRVGKAVHCHLLRCLRNPSRIVFNALLSTYATCLSALDQKNDCFSEFCDVRCDLVAKVFKGMRKKDVVAWNTTVSWYVKTKRYLKAFLQFRRMMKTGVKPTAISFVNVFPALSGLGDTENSKVIYGMITKLGDDYIDDLFVISSMILTFTELGLFDLAQDVFYSCAQKNIEVWNTMIGAYIDNGFPVEGLEIFLLAMESKDTVLNDVTFLLALSAASRLQQLGLAQQLHAFMIKHFRKLPVFILNSIIAMYSRCNSVHQSFKVFEAMPVRDIVSWNTLVSAFLQHGFNDEALLLVYEMKKQGFVLDSITAAALLSLSSNLRNKDTGKQTHAYILRHGLVFEGMDCYLIDMYAKSGLISTSEQIFYLHYSADRDRATWNAMIAGLAQNELNEEALFTFREMLQQNVLPNAVSLASILPACGTTGSMYLGKQLHGFSVRNSLDQNIFVGTALVDMYSKSGSIVYAENVFAMIMEKNTVTYNSMILGYGQHGMGQRALSLLKAMQESNIQPDMVTFVALLSACSYSGLVDEGLQILNSMESEFKIRPLKEHYCCVTDMLGRSGRVSEAYEFVQGLGEDGNVLEIWGSLLGACKLHRMFDLGEVVARKIVEMDIGNSTGGYHVLLSNMYAEEGNWRSVDRVRSYMKQRGLRKAVGQSWIQIEGYTKYFSSNDQEHPQSNDVHEILDT